MSTREICRSGRVDRVAIAIFVCDAESLQRDLPWMDDSVRVPNVECNENSAAEVYLELTPADSKRLRLLVLCMDTAHYFENF